MLSKLKRAGIDDASLLENKKIKTFSRVEIMNRTDVYVLPLCDWLISSMEKRHNTVGRGESFGLRLSNFYLPSRGRMWN